MRLRVLLFACVCLCVLASSPRTRFRPFSPFYVSVFLPFLRAGLPSAASLPPYFAGVAFYLGVSPFLIVFFVGVCTPALVLRVSFNKACARARPVENREADKIKSCPVFSFLDDAAMRLYHEHDSLWITSFIQGTQTRTCTHRDLCANDTLEGRRE